MGRRTVVAALVSAAVVGITGCSGTSAPPASQPTGAPASSAGTSPGASTGASTGTSPGAVKAAGTWLAFTQHKAGQSCVVTRSATSSQPAHRYLVKVVKTGPASGGGEQFTVDRRLLGGGDLTSSGTQTGRLAPSGRLSVTSLVHQSEPGSRIVEGGKETLPSLAQFRTGSAGHATAYLTLTIAGSSSGGGGGVLTAAYRTGAATAVTIKIRMMLGFRYFAPKGPVTTPAGRFANLIGVRESVTSMHVLQEPAALRQALRPLLASLRRDEAVSSVYARGVGFVVGHLSNGTETLHHCSG
jgi:hypothetical protein